MKYLLRLFLLVLSAHIPCGYLHAESTTILFIANTPEQDSVFEHRYFEALQQEGYQPVTVYNDMRQGVSVSDFKRDWPEARGLVFLGINPEYSKRCLLTIADTDPTPSAPWLSFIPTGSAKETLEYLDLSLSFRKNNIRAPQFNLDPLQHSAQDLAHKFSDHFTLLKQPLLAVARSENVYRGNSSGVRMSTGQWFQQQLHGQLETIKNNALRRIKNQSILYMPSVKNTEFLHTLTAAAWTLIIASHSARYLQGIPTFRPIDKKDKVIYPIYYTLAITSSALSGLMVSDYLDEFYYWMYPDYWTNLDHSNEAACSPVLLGDGTLSSSILPQP